MQEFYELKLGDKPVGEVRVTQEGLYYRFRCRCRLDVDSVCKVFAADTSLGVLVPEGEEFVLNTKLPVKRFGKENFQFQVMPNRPVLDGQFIPIKPEEPFAYIERLKNAYLTRQNGQIGIVIQEKAGT